MNDVIVAYLYVVAVVLFVLSLRWMSSVSTSQRGNWSGAAGMVVAILATLLAFQVRSIDLLVAAVVVGTIVGMPIALKLPMTAVPQRTAMSHAFGSLAVALIG
ncbi:MAG: NAD(P)(+) transhydrogenase (Re/Si-specific) subunit beta, partial [Thaumarchaeota archaeon]|nr:NAD(P)(+) transhydrogenase (Re/Si-specific) subunit beta [Nitrososphaerota archaeon]